MATAIVLVNTNTLVTFFEITSIENSIPAIGLQNNVVTPAAIPAPINTVLYLCKKTDCR